MNRRDFLAVVGAAPWLVLEAYGEPQEKLPRIGFLGRLPPNLSAGEELRQGLREFGYVEGKDILIEWRQTLGYEDELRPLAAELVRMNVAVIVTFGTPAARAALEATKTIPVVFTAVGDAVATGLTASLAKPSANGTGVSLLGAETATKRFDYLHQLSPRIRRVAFLGNSANPATVSGLESVRVAAQSVGINLDIYNARNAGRSNRRFARSRGNRWTECSSQAIPFSLPKAPRSPRRCARPKCRPYSPGASSTSTACSCRTARIGETPCAAALTSWPRSSRAPSRLICLSSKYRGSNSSSTCAWRAN